MTTANRLVYPLKSNTSYTFHVRAKNNMGQWGPLSDPKSLTTTHDTTAPATPAGGSLAASIPNFFTLQWTAGTEKDLESYHLYVYTSDTAGSAKVIKRVGYATTRVIVTVGEKTEDESITITAGVTYYFWLTAVDESGNESDKLAVGSASIPLIRNVFSYSADVADEGTFDLVAVTNSAFGWVIAGNNEERAIFTIDNDGDVTIIDGSANVVANADTDDKLCLGTAGTQEPLTVKNHLGATKNINLVLWYN